MQLSLKRSFACASHVALSALHLQVSHPDLAPSQKSSMFPYLLSWALFAFACLGNPRRIARSALLALGVFLTLLIGLRDQVGGDWFSYLPYIARSTGLTLVDVFLESDPGYGLFNWIGANLGGSVFLVNTLCGLVFTIGLLAFCRSQPRPLLALTLAFPYLVTVVAMGYSRRWPSVWRCLPCLPCSAIGCCSFSVGSPLLPLSTAPCWCCWFASSSFRIPVSPG